MSEDEGKKGVRGEMSQRRGRNGKPLEEERRISPFYRGPPPMFGIASEIFRNLCEIKM